MIAINSKDNKIPWQSSFVAMLGEIEQKLRLAFCRLGPEAREDAIEEGVVHCLVAYIRLHDKGRAEVATPSSLAWYASRQVKRGRPASGRMNGKDPLSRYAQLGSGIHVEQLHSNWIDAYVQDTRAPVADQVATKMDAVAWFSTLPRRMRQIAKDLAFGCSTLEVARKYDVTASRISQLRRSLEQSWAAFQKEEAPTLV
jgi:hypothetical protein